MEFEYIQTKSEREFIDTMKNNICLLKDPEMVKDGFILLGAIITTFTVLILIGV